MEIEIVRADPAGNITIFVLNPPGTEQERTEIAKILLADKNLAAEQIGFVFSPSVQRHWRLEMAGGEFCGNASRSFGLLIAAITGLSGKHTLMIETSGAKELMPVHIDTGEQTAEIMMQGPVAETEIILDERHFPVYIFEGITHIIAENIPPDKKHACLLMREVDTQCAASQNAAIGVMFYDSQKCFMQPAVWVKATDTLIFESSCGSGSAALGVWTLRNMPDAETSIALAQPGGTIIIRAAKQAGKITSLSITGKVILSEVFRYRY